MQGYYGTKRLKAIAMTRGAYNDYRGWIIPPDEDPEDGGYLVEYQDGGKPNDSRHEGYISWSPKDVFESAYQPTHALSFGHALEVLKSGGKVRRSSWEAKDVFLKRLEDGSGQEYLGIGSAISSGFPRSRPTDADLFANDWEIVE